MIIFCKPINNDSTHSSFKQIKPTNLVDITRNQRLILDIIKSLNINKARSLGNISGHMIELCGENITLPLNIIIKKIIDTGIFPTVWKSANVTPVHKKDSKQVINNYRPISLLHFCKTFLKGLHF